MSELNYIKDVSYTSGFYPQTAPSWLGFSAALAGHAPGGALRPRRVFELGMGQGFGIALLAAANPDVQFEGCDFNPDHVSQAQQFIENAALQNVSVHEMDFAAAARMGSSGDIDLALAHGILSWVAPDVQHDIVTFLKRKLRDDGAFYVSYNSAVGWAALAPIRDLFLAIKRGSAGGSRAQLAMALDWLQRLRRANAPVFVANPAAAQHLDAMLAMDPSYLAHEYFAEAARPMHFSEAASLLQEAGLGYVATANLVENFDALAMPAAALPMLAEADDPVLRETLRDFAVNRFFRRDLFARGERSLTPAEQREALSSFRCILSVPRARLNLDLRGPAGALTGRPDLYGPLADRLVAGAGIEELAGLPGFEGRFDRLLHCLALLIDSHQARPAPAGPAVDPQPARRFNRMVLEAARRGVIYGHLASPVTGSGFALHDSDLMALAAIDDGAALDAETLANRCLAMTAALGRRPMRNGVAIDGDTEAIDFLADSMRHIVEEALPLWQRFGIA